MFVWKDENKRKKAEDGLFFKKTIVNYHFNYKILSHLVSGVTDSKAVTGSKTGFDFGGSAAGSIVVIVTGVAAGIVFTVLLVCLFVTCKRKVSVTRVNFLNIFWSKSSFQELNKAGTGPRSTAKFKLKVQPRSAPHKCTEEVN